MVLLLKAIPAHKRPTLLRTLLPLPLCALFPYHSRMNFFLFPLGRWLKRTNFGNLSSCVQKLVSRFGLWLKRINFGNLSSLVQKLVSRFGLRLKIINFGNLSSFVQKLVSRFGLWLKRINFANLSSFFKNWSVDLDYG